MNSVYEKTKSGFIFSTDRGKLDLEMIHQYLSKESYWAQNIPMEIVKRSIENAVCFGIYDKTIQVGFARVVTDKATFAYLADVFIIETYRGKGLSKLLMAFIHAHPELQGLRRWMLGTRDAHTLYEQFGWTKFTEEIYPRFMQLHDVNVYLR